MYVIGIDTDARKKRKSEIINEQVADMAKIVEQTTKFLKEVRLEMSKVTWPTWIELRGSTVLVIIVSIFFAAYIGIFDIIITFIVGFLTGGKIR